MKYFYLFFTLLTIATASSQTNEDLQVKETVVSFFEAFHKQDETAMKKVVKPEIILQTIGINKEGKQQLRSENFDDLINSLVSIPDSINFQEKILDYTIQIDGAMASVWTPYEFWLNGKFHHCGVNSFQLFKEKQVWKIIYLIDTRRKKGCQNSTK